MEKREKQSSEAPPAGASSTPTAVAKPKKRARTASAKKPAAELPAWKVLLHNDDKNDIVFVVHTIVELTPLNMLDAKNRTLEAHKTGIALLLVTHKELAELYHDQFQSKGLTVTIEPDC